MSKLTIKSQREPKPLDPTGDPMKWQRLKVRDHEGGRRGRLPSRGCPYLGLAPTFSPQSLPAKRREGEEKGLDR